MPVSDHTDPHDHGHTTADSIPRVSGQDPAADLLTATEAEPSAARERILDAMTRLTVDYGYEQTTIRRLLLDSHVARATFYRQFADKHDCLLAAQRSNAQRLLQALRSDGEDPLIALLAFTARNPHGTRLLAEVPVLGDPQALHEHNHWRRDIASAISTREEALADLPVAVLTGGIMRVLAGQGGEPTADPPPLARAITRWLHSYLSPGVSLEHLDPNPAIGKVFIDSAASSAALEGVDSVDATDSARLQILRALLRETARDNPARSVGDLAAAAGVSRETFYGNFTGRAAAIERLRQIIFGDVIALCMRTFVLYDTWPEQLWHVGQLLTSFLDQYPKLARFLLLGPLRQHGGGPPSCLNAFAVFLEPGIAALAPDERSLNVELIIATAVELLCEGLDTATPLHTQLPRLTFLALAPCLGTEKAVQFIEEKRREIHRSTRRRS